MGKITYTDAIITSMIQAAEELLADKGVALANSIDYGKCNNSVYAEMETLHAIIDALNTMDEDDDSDTLDLYLDWIIKIGDYSYADVVSTSFTGYENMDSNCDCTSSQKLASEIAVFESAMRLALGGYDNTLFVDKDYGSDATGARENFLLPYATIGAAEADAQSGDTIYIRPNTHVASGLGKDGVTYFLDNAKIETTGDIFDDSGTDMSFTIKGVNSEIVSSSASALKLSGSGSDVVVLNVLLKSTADDGVIEHDGGVLTLLEVPVVNTNSGSSAHGIVSSGATLLRVRDTKIYLTSATAESINASVTYNVMALNDFGGTNPFNSNVTNDNPSTWIYNQSALTWT